MFPSAVIVLVNPDKASITNSDNWTVSWKTYWISVTSPLNITTYLFPSAVIVLINPDKATISDSNNRPIRRKTYWSPKVMPRSFTINIFSYLFPCIINILINADKATISSIWIIPGSTNSYNRTICWKTYWISWRLSFGFSNNITANLSPAIVDILINSYKTTFINKFIVRIPISIHWSSYCNNRSITGKTYWMSWGYINFFSINIVTYLSPIIIDIFKNFYVTAGAIFVIFWIISVHRSTNSYNRTICWKTYWIPWSITFFFPYDILANLRKSFNGER